MRFARATVYALVLPWLVVCFWKTSHGATIYVAGVFLIGLLALALVRWPVQARWAQAGEVVLWNGVLAFLLVEGGVRAYFALGQPPAWLTPEPDTVLYRLDPAGEWMGFKPNSRGFFDGEFSETKEPGVIRVVSLGDSYTVGVVPYPENYLSIVDNEFGDAVEILNLGVVHTEVPHYLEILRSEGLRLKPDVILVGVYIGNDIQPASARGLFSRAGSKALSAARMALTVVRFGAPYRQASSLSSFFQSEPDGTKVELPGMTVDRYYAREWKHLLRLFRPPESPRMKRAWRDTTHAVEQLAGFCQEEGIPLLATLAPDEIQVSPTVFRETLSRYDADPNDFDLDYPRRRILDKLKALSVPVLDFTEPLQKAEREASTYHLRAVHWNGHGNAVAATALTPWLSKQLAGLGLKVRR